jgi:hypothetical protein
MTAIFPRNFASAAMVKTQSVDKRLKVNRCVKGSRVSPNGLGKTVTHSAHSAVGRIAVRAAHSLHRLTQQRPARTTNPIAPTERWCSDSGKVRVNVTGNSTRAVRLHPSLALGLEQHRGCQMERAIFLRSPCRSYDKTEDWL